MGSEDLQSEDFEDSGEEPQEGEAQDLEPRVIADENRFVDFSHLKRYHEKLKSIIPPFTYYFIGVESPSDVGAIGASYILTTADL